MPQPSQDADTPARLARQGERTGRRVTL